MTSLIGAARTLVAVRDRWSGTIVFVAQPAEEIVAGARAMLADGLYTRFPKPDFALTLHDDAMLPAGVIGYGEGPFMSAVSSLDILVRGVSGHGSAPHTTKDPVVLASQIVVALQTIVSREVAPGHAGGRHRRHDPRRPEAQHHPRRSEAGTHAARLRSGR